MEAEKEQIAFMLQRALPLDREVKETPLLIKMPKPCI